MATFRDYGGVCHGCNSPIYYDGEMIVIEIENTIEYIRVVPVNIYECSFCGEIMRVVKIYKNLDISKELAEL